MGMARTERNKHLWLFNCANTFSGNPKWLFLYVTKFRPDIDAWWIASDAETVTKIRRLGFQAETMESRAGRALQEQAGVWVVNQVKEVIPEELEGAVLLNLWHGVGVKGIERGMNAGYLQERIFRKHITNNQTYHNCQLFLVTSPAMEQHFSKQIGLAPDRVIRAGYPQNLYTRLHGEVSTFDHDLLGSRGLPHDTRIALYAPTPRREFGHDFLADAFPDVPLLLKTLEREKILLVVKMHPHMTKDPAFVRLRAQYGDNPYLLFWNNDNDVYEVFHKIDIAIVDYSSILYDLLSSGVTRVIRYIFDFDFAAAERGDSGNAVIEPGVPYLELSCGEIAADSDGLLAVLGADCTVSESDLARLNAHFWSYATDDTFDTIIESALAFEPTSDTLPPFHSFDVFDTLIARRVIEPRGVFYQVRFRMEQSPGAFPPYLVKDFVPLRMEAESNVRQSRRKDPALVASGDLEITLTQIYERLADLHSLDAGQVAQLMEWEMEAELDNCIPRPSIINRVHELVDEGVDVVLISDQYLPVDFVRKLLAKADPLLAELPLYLSNEQRAQKSTRKLYLKVFADRDWKYSYWNHTGDNPRADVLRPAELGIVTRRIRTPRLKAFERRLVEAIDTYDAWLVAGEFHLARGRTGDFSGLDRFAYTQVALYLVPYLEWVVTDAVARGYRTLYFISRDGHHMKPIADALIEELGLDLRTRYIYGSRRAWRLASQIDGIDTDTFSPYGSFSGVQSLAEVAETADLKVSELVAMVPALARYQDVEVLRQGELTKVREQLEASRAFRDHLNRKARKDRDLATAYLRQEITPGESFAFVEYWGRGYTQDCLARLLAHAAGQSVPTPFYYARSIYLTDGASIRHNFTSATHSMIFVEAIFANLPYGTVEGYREEQGRILPICAERDHDEALHDAMATQLPRFAHAFASLPLLDRERARRDLFAFAFADFTEHKEDPLYVQRLAHLKDAVNLGAAETEFAPALTVGDFVRHLSGQRISKLTRSMEMSTTRSKSLPIKLFAWREKYDWPRWIPEAERDLEDPRRWRRDRDEKAKLQAARQRGRLGPTEAGRIRRRISAARSRLGRLARPFR